MRVVCVYREGEDYSRMVSDWLENFRRQTGRVIETLNPDLEVRFCETYGIMEYPSILALGDQGEVFAAWHGRELPTFNEVLYYMI